MGRKLKILHLEDSPSDAKLVRTILKRGDFDFEVLVVESKSKFINALEDFSPDIILSDHSLPSFNSHEALNITRKRGLKIPFILITANVSEEFAVDVIKRGADDYILKDRLQRLPNAIHNALKKNSLEIEKQNYLAHVIKNEKHYRALIENGSDVIVVFNLHGKLTYASPSIYRVLGYTETEALQLSLYEIVHPDDIEKIEHVVTECIKYSGKPLNAQVARVKNKNGEWIWIDATVTNMLHEPTINGIINNFRDISQRILTEEIIKESEEKYRSFYENSMDGILLTVPNGEVLSANPAACEIFQMTEEEICKAGIIGLMDHFDSNGALDITGKRLNVGAKSERTFVRKDGSKFPGELTSAVFKDAKDNDRSSLIIRDISERKIAEDLIHRSELQYRNLIQDLPVAVYTTDKFGKIQLYNKAAALLWGREPEIGKDKWCGSWKIFNTEGFEMPLEACPMAVTLKTGIPLLGQEIIVEQPCGEKRTIAPHPFPVYDLEGRMQGTINMLVDITDQKEAEEKLKLQQTILIKINSKLTAKNKSIVLAKKELTIKAFQLEESSRYKSEFLANMSHELRTPLNSILILSGLLSENKALNLSPKQLQYADVITKSGTDLLSLINDILDLAKIESGKIDLYYEKVDSLYMVGHMRELFWALSEEKQIDFHISVSPHFPKHLCTDKQRLEQVIKNLLSNAFKFTPSGGKVELVMELDISVDKQIRITVSDTGVGIPEDKKQQIFEAFEQADGSTTRKYGGTGLGLSISKELIHKLGGDIYVESVFGDGSTFIILLPLLEGEEKHQEKIVQPAINMNDSYVLGNGELFARKVLLVDDEMRNIFAVSHLLREHGMEVYTAGTGKEALQILIENDDVEIILMDIMMPEMDGYEAMRQIRRDEKYKDLPIIALTAKAMVGDAEKCMQAGASSYISKPFANKHLLSQLKYWLNKHQEKQINQQKQTIRLT